ncbi:hypothetical protein GCM10009575_099480 [Streptomyces rhizosphaericus]|uniref:Uncharacterized protein n=1 Tax=Streptomyces rhizosphaericus TaxID=114699 RepID=A0ABN1RWI8_9ACTN
MLNLPKIQLRIGNSTQIYLEITLYSQITGNTYVIDRPSLGD